MHKPVSNVHGSFHCPCCVYDHRMHEAKKAEEACHMPLSEEHMPWKKLCSSILLDYRGENGALQVQSDRETGFPLKKIL